MKMRCGISGCSYELSLQDTTIHYAQYHQKFTCDNCKKTFIGLKSFTHHPSVECIQVLNKSNLVVSTKKSKKPLNKNEKILEWLKKLSQAKLDPSATFASLNITDYDQEYCKKKVRYKNTDDAILALMKMEKSLKEPILQMPYRCPCKSVHNTHLISRRALSELITKYEERNKRVRDSKKRLPPKG
jgi:hypothetical protein